MDTKKLRITGKMFERKVCMITFTCPNCEGEMPVDSFGKCPHCEYGSMAEGYIAKPPKNISDAINDAIDEIHVHMEVSSPVGSNRYKPTLRDLTRREVIFLLERTLQNMKGDSRIGPDAYEAVMLEIRKLYE